MHLNRRVIMSQSVIEKRGSDRLVVESGAKHGRMVGRHVRSLNASVRLQRGIKRRQDRLLHWWKRGEIWVFNG